MDARIEVVRCGSIVFGGAVMDVHESIVFLRAINVLVKTNFGISKMLTPQSSMARLGFNCWPE